MASIMRFALVCILALLQLSLVAGLDMDYCASLNTGASFKAVVDTFQSNGACRETCYPKYAFAIMKGKSCWCSDAAPGDTTDTGSCNDKCPGFPDDTCGNQKKGLFGYVQLDKAPTTTIGDKKITSTTLTSSRITKSPTVSTSTSSGGGAVTVTMSDSPQSTAPSTGSSENKGGSSLGGGAIAGIIIGSLAGAGILLALIIWFFCFRRRQKEPAERDYTNPFYEPPVPQPTFRTPLSGPLPKGRTNGHTLPLPAFTDHRLKNGIYPNGSRRSNVSLQDNHDYSRPVLRLTNPDAPES